MSPNYEKYQELLKILSVEEALEEYTKWIIKKHQFAQKYPIGFNHSYE